MATGLAVLITGAAILGHLAVAVRAAIDAEAAELERHQADRRG